MQPIQEAHNLPNGARLLIEGHQNTENKNGNYTHSFIGSIIAIRDDMTLNLNITQPRNALNLFYVVMQFIGNKAETSINYFSNVDALIHTQYYSIGDGYFVITKWTASASYDKRFYQIEHHTFDNQMDFDYSAYNQHPLLALRELLNKVPETKP